METPRHYISKAFIQLYQRKLQEVGAGQRNYSNLCNNQILIIIATEKRQEQSIDAHDKAFQ